MNSFTLSLESPPAVVSPEVAASTFYWTPGQPKSSFNSDVGPLLGKFGDVPGLNADFVRIAAAVYGADRSVLRKRDGSNWNQRDISLTIPVSRPSAWRAVTEDLSSVLAFLTGDRWKLAFSKQPVLSEAVQLPTAKPTRVVLLSGGADSAIGALKSRSELELEESHLLISHYSNSNTVSFQREAAEAVARMVPGPGQQHEVINFSRRAHRADGTAFQNEFSTRSRSLLFLALGLAAASVHDVPLWIPENGFASINPPLGPERRGSLSTRTTHPRFLESLEDVLRRAGAVATIVNPFAAMTKGEMFRWVADSFGQGVASSFLSATYSCSTTGQRSFKISTKVQCGVCFGCTLRRSSFKSSGVPDQTDYVNPAHSTPVRHWLAKNSVESAVTHFVDRGVRPRDLMALGLPASYRIADALDLCRRGVEELRSLSA